MGKDGGREAEKGMFMAGSEASWLAAGELSVTMLKDNDGTPLPLTPLPLPPLP